MPQCPHCSEPIEKLTGFVAESTLAERLANKQAGHEKAIAKLAAKISASDAARDEALQKLTDYDGVDVAKMERRYAKAIETAEAAQAELASFRVETETNLVWAQNQIEDEETRDLVLYRFGKLDEATRPTLADYLQGPAKEDRFLQPLLGGTQSDAGSADSTSAAQGNGNGRAHDPNAGVIASRQATDTTLQSIFSAPDYAGKVRVAGSHEALEKALGYHLPRPKGA